MHDFRTIMAINKIYKVFYSLSFGVFSPSSPKFKIINSIVVSNAIFMMNPFTFFKRSFQMFFHNISMFRFYLFTIFESNKSISMRRHCYPTLPAWIKFSRPIKITTFSRTVISFRIIQFPCAFPNLLFTFIAFFKSSIHVSVSKRTGISILSNSIEKLMAYRAISTINQNVSGFYYLIECHFLSPIKEMGRAVVTECRSIHDTPQNRKCLGTFGNTHSLAWI